jgi:phenol/toluene 2-monooxygenase (NADH) P4/A4
MTVKALAEYDFPSRDRVELFGDDQLVNVLWDGNFFFPMAACFRVPKAMRWADFRSQMVDPVFSADPDYRPAHAKNWKLDETPFTPTDDASLADLGVVHKGLIRFEV